MSEFDPTPPADDDVTSADVPPSAPSSRPSATPPPTTPPPATPPPAVPPPAPAFGGGMSASDQRNWAMGAHLSSIALSLLGGLAVLGPLIVWLVKKDDDAFVAEHARESLNFQLTWLIGGFVGVIAAFLLAVVTLGIGLFVLVPAGIGFAIAWLVFVIKATIAASNGQPYRYPLTVRMVAESRRARP